MFLPVYSSSYVHSIESQISFNLLPIPFLYLYYLFNLTLICSILVCSIQICSIQICSILICTILWESPTDHLPSNNDNTSENTSSLFYLSTAGASGFPTRVLTRGDIQVVQVFAYLSIFRKHSPESESRAIAPNYWRHPAYFVIARTEETFVLANQMAFSIANQKSGW